MTLRTPTSCYVRYKSINLINSAILLLVIVTGCYRTKRPMYYDHFLIHCALHVSINRS